MCMEQTSPALARAFGGITTSRFGARGLSHHLAERTLPKERTLSTQKTTKSSTKTGSAPRNSSRRFTDEERAAMKERAGELKAGKGDGEAAVLAKIAEMPDADRAMAE